MRFIHKEKKEKKYIYDTSGPKISYLFCFLSEKTKKREYLFYQKCYEKYYGKPFDSSYKKFWRMMLRKSILYWFITIFFPILIILFFASILLGGDDMGMSTIDVYRSKRILSCKETKPIFVELEKQWAEEDRLEALQKEAKKH